MSAPTMSVPQGQVPGPGFRPDGLPRLLPPSVNVPEGLRDHLARHGFVPYRNAKLQLIGDLKAAGLTGRGGAAFPVYRKMAAVAEAGGQPFVVGNGAESEPASNKDMSLLWLAPHLVLDGLQLAAEAVGATEAALYVHEVEAGPLGESLRRALSERWSARIDRVPVRLASAPPRFLAGQETAMVNLLNGGLALPTYASPRVFARGVGGAPTLVQNVETLAHIALVARFGPRWFRQVGTAAEPGSMLCTIHHADGSARIVEAAIGTPLPELIGADLGPHGLDGETRAVLIGGYHGTWVPAVRAAELTLDNAAMAAAGGILGAGVIAALPANRCGLAEAARVVRYLALESAGQCGPCLNGLPRIAEGLSTLSGPRPSPAVRASVERWAGLVTGRGACSHPDGSARFVRSALAVFSAELRHHEEGLCSAASQRPFLPLPAEVAVRDEDWS
ncbi:MAG TPA: NADH-ubiquinone oxidoreductase-F iron-sulfur binding region domain-containing protein [Streptosporangiaceae bacterium]|nr:NADH-ubiquinone oxidoreductase-F iron-sulfur binding region domain-containing protein [Streptosporangiaceae bacterium]